MKTGDKIYHKEFFWIGTLISIRPEYHYTCTPLVKYGYVEWDDPNLPSENINLEEIELYDFKGIIQGAIHHARKTSQKN